MWGRKQHLIIGLLVLLIYWANARWIKPTSGKFIGSASCASCHKDIYDTHIKTAHYLDSRPAAAAFIKGSFDPGKNHFVYNQHMEVVMEKKKGRFFQTALFNGNILESEAFDIVIGSGRKGQTYLYWDGARLFQLPVSYYTPLDSWCNSPGYPTNLIYYNKQTHGQCMECHSTHVLAEEQEDKGTVFDKSSIIYGIDCERCHGPAADHVTFHQAHPGEKTGRYIINTRLLGRQQRLDACALCHSGLRQPLKSPLTFVVGDTLDNYSTPAYSADSVSSLDVHANQYGLLTSSKCFQMTPQMDCSSCHNVHVTEVNTPELFSRRCMNCHNETAHNTCNFPPVNQWALYTNCIDCHMPALPSRKISLQLSDPDKQVRDLVRTHHVGIYPVSAKEYLEKLKIHYP
ncbi:MAG TPA: cytochrome c3 family protein [Puia sp.]